MSKPTLTMIRAVRAIALSRGDYDNSIYEAVASMTFEQASNYISKYGRKVSYARS